MLKKYTESTSNRTTSRDSNRTTGRDTNRTASRDSNRPASKDTNRDTNRTTGRDTRKDGKSFNDTKQDRKGFRDSKVYNDNKIKFESNKRIEYGHMAEAEESNKYQIEGRNVVLEALKVDRQIDKIFMSTENNTGSILVINALAKEKGIIINKVGKAKLDEMSLTKNHQGVIAFVAAHDYSSIDDIFSLAEKRGEEPFIVILDHIKDPHNLGAVIRTAEACGVHGVIIPKNRAVGLTATVEKAAAGALMHIPIVKESNISGVIDKLKERGVWVYCADTKGNNLFDEDISGACCVIIGSEGDGASSLVKKKSDVLIKIPMFGQISSLNASVSAGVILYEIVRRRNLN